MFSAKLHHVQHPKKTWSKPLNNYPKTFHLKLLLYWADWINVVKWYSYYLTTDFWVCLQIYVLNELTINIACEKEHVWRYRSEREARSKPLAKECTCKRERGKYLPNLWSIAIKIIIKCLSRIFFLILSTCCERVHYLII